MLFQLCLTCDEYLTSTKMSLVTSRDIASLKAARALIDITSSLLNYYPSSSSSLFAPRKSNKLTKFSPQLFGAKSTFNILF